MVFLFQFSVSNCQREMHISRKLLLVAKGHVFWREKIKDKSKWSFWASSSELGPLKREIGFYLTLKGGRVMHQLWKRSHNVKVRMEWTILWGLVRLCFLLHSCLGHIVIAGIKILGLVGKQRWKKYIIWYIASKKHLYSPLSEVVSVRIEGLVFEPMDISPST